MDEAGARARINSMTRPPDMKEIEKEIEKIRAEKESAIKAQDFEKAAALRDSELHTKDKLERILNGWREQRDEREGTHQPCRAALSARHAQPLLAPESRALCDRRP